MRKSVCLDCHRIGEWARGRCPEHERARDQRRGTRRERGYDAAYERVKREYEAQVRSGVALTCVRCGLAITTTPVTPDHDAERTAILGPAHPRCNLRAAGLARHGISPSD